MQTTEQDLAKAILEHSDLAARKFKALSRLDQAVAELKRVTPQYTPLRVPSLKTEPRQVSVGRVQPFPTDTHTNQNKTEHFFEEEPTDSLQRIESDEQAVDQEIEEWFKEKQTLEAERDELLQERDSLLKQMHNQRKEAQKQVKQQQWRQFVYGKKTPKARPQL